MSTLPLRVLFLSCLLLIVASSNSFAQKSLIVLNENVLLDYWRFVGQREPMEVNTYSGTHSRRDVIELLLLMQMLELGGFNHEIKFHPEHSYKRILHMLSQGYANVYGTPVWHLDIASEPELFWASEAMVRPGEFVVGIYTSPSNLTAMRATADTITNLTAVSSRQWSADWATLTALKLKWLYNTNTWDHMVKMVNAGRADFTLSPFYPTDDMRLKVGNVTLAPIPNLRLAFNDSRHWAVSRKHPNGPEMQEAIAKGMAILRQRGTIVRAYTESGFFDQRVKHWPVIKIPAAEVTPISSALHD